MESMICGVAVARNQSQMEAVRMSILSLRKQAEVLAKHVSSEYNGFLNKNIQRFHCRMEPLMAL